MANIPAGVIFVWTGSIANIPSGWVRETSLDTKFPKGTADATNPNTTGGAATHSHTSPAHTHSTTAHTHTLSYTGYSGGSNVDSGSGSGAGRNGHTHADHNSGAVASDSVQNSTSTYASFSNNPPYNEVIFITPSVPKSGIPTNVIGLIDDTGYVNNSGKYTGTYFCDGNNSTTDLRNKYIKGASASSEIGASGGSYTNVHNLTHTHTTSHTHSASTSGAPTLQSAATGGNDCTTGSHTHTDTVSAATPTTSDTPSLTTTETVEPAYTKLAPIQNKSSLPVAFRGLIGMWLGTLANIPANYLLCQGTNGTDMRGRHLKMANAISEIGNTGGSNTHTHASQGHTHTLSSHTHTVTTSTAGNDTRHSGNGQGAISSHAHTVSASSVAHTLQSSNTTADSSNNEPEYRTLAFIKLNALEQAGGSFIYNLL